ncbi:MAG: FmdE family protein [Candidatus Jordarchaeum sp.]|uniref:FmdE family protein n=1 Tax=Candidatus Jordarchaeum sp. TaxID=2823881 RepID=UPI0040496711
MVDFKNLFEDAVEFHGHTCLGLLIGVRMGVAALNILDVDRVSDEELYAVVENDSCAVDGLQTVTGVTLGKGNLLFKDYGKMAATFYLRNKKKAIRLVFKPESFGKIADEKDLREAMSEENPEKKMAKFAKIVKRFGDLPDNEVFDILSVEMDEPPMAEIRQSVRCEKCGEMTMETKSVVMDGKHLCIPCSTNMNYYRVK